MQVEALLLEAFLSRTVPADVVSLASVLTSVPPGVPPWFLPCGGCLGLAWVRVGVGFVPCGCRSAPAGVSFVPVVGCLVGPRGLSFGGALWGKGG